MKERMESYREFQLNRNGYLVGIMAAARFITACQSMPSVARKETQGAEINDALEVYDGEIGRAESRGTGSARRQG
jgi:hypothetical protein